MPTNAINDTGVKYVYDKLNAKKVDKETGKGLSTNDYTTAEKNKVATIDNKADKVTSATNGNLAGLNGSGNLTDSGWNGAKDTTSISGNPISISGLKANQLAVNPIITLEPIQAGSGTPSPSNIRAISGYDKVEALSCGKNLFDSDWLLAATGWTKDSNGLYSGLNTNLYSKYRPDTTNGFPVKFKPNTQYTFSLDGLTSTLNYYVSIMILYTDGTTSDIVQVRATSLTHYTGTSAANKTIAKIGASFGAGANVSLKNIQVEEATAETTYEPYNKITDFSESLGQTVYGATWYPRTGKATVTYKAVDLGNLDYSYRGDIVTGVFSNSVINDYVLSFTVKTLCEKYNFFGTVPAVQSMADVPDKSFALYYQTGQTATALYIKDTSYNNATTFKASLSGVKLVYELATYGEIQLTPHEISLLKDYAYVSTNGTNIALDYHNGELASLADVSQLGETLNKGLSPFTLDISNQMTKLLSSATFKAYRNGNVVQIAGRTGALSNGVNNIVQIPNALRDTNQMPIPVYIYLSASDSGKVNGMYIDSSGIIAASANSATGNGIIFSVVYVLP